MKKTKKKLEKPLKKAPSVEDDGVSVILSKEELDTLINFMAICSKTFETLALKAAQDNDKEAFSVLAARQKLSNIYMTKLIASNMIGEPESRDYH